MSSEWHQAGEASSTDGVEGLAPRYLAFFDCFNDGRFFEAHEVLEAVWRPARGTLDARFYQGLIQLAGAFVHLEQRRTAPAIRLLRLARANLMSYPPVHLRLDLTRVRALILSWLDRLEPTPHPASARTQPPPPGLLMSAHDRPHVTLTPARCHPTEVVGSPPAGTGGSDRVACPNESSGPHAALDAG